MRNDWLKQHFRCMHACNRPRNTKVHKNGISEEEQKQDVLVEPDLLLGNSANQGSARASTRRVNYQYILTVNKIKEQLFNVVF